MQPEAELEVLIRARYPIVYVVSYEEQRVEEGIRAICERRGRTLHTWSITRGIRPPVDRVAGPERPAKLDPELEVLALMKEAPEFTVFLLKDFHPFLKDHRVKRLIRDLSDDLLPRKQTLVLVSPVMELPPEIEKGVTIMNWPLMSAQEIEPLLDQVVASVGERKEVETTMEPVQKELLIKSVQGLTKLEIENVLARSLIEKRKFDLEVVSAEKKQIAAKSGLLEYYPPLNTLSDVGGLELLKEWLDTRKGSLTDKAREFGLPNPKGLLILGVQGCGKSLLAKTIASEWRLPLLRLDVGRIFGSLVGQSEQNMRRAIAIAESLAPCCLWADEIEKAFAGTSGAAGDSGTSARVFATFLTWMQEKTKPVFLVATANDISKLPPEMLRKGRFDEIFFVDLPDKDERADIFAIHLRKRKRDPKNFDLATFAAITKGYSGAEIEQIVVGALYRAFARTEEPAKGKRKAKATDVTDAEIRAEIEAVVPLSRMMQEEIAWLRDWAEKRTRPSSDRKGD
ncbi:MAG: ATPase [Chthonomonas sp.]